MPKVTALGPSLKVGFPMASFEHASVGMVEELEVPVGDSLLVGMSVMLIGLKIAGSCGTGAIVAGNASAL